MPFDMESLKALPGKLSTFLGSDAAPVVLGEAAQGIMAGHPNTWQSGLGAVGAGFVAVP